jgi:hypothetical protein
MSFAQRLGMRTRTERDAEAKAILEKLATITTEVSASEAEAITGAALSDIISAVRSTGGGRKYGIHHTFDGNTHTFRPA